MKIHKGTPIHSKSLCDTCKRAQRLKGMAESQEHVYCNELQQFVHIKVSECSKYTKEGSTSLWDMQQIAWKVCTDKSGKRIGFLSPSDIHKRRDDVTIDGSPLPDDD